jgi:hypothetical protein
MVAALFVIVMMAFCSEVLYEEPNLVSAYNANPT